MTSKAAISRAALFKPSQSRPVRSHLRSCRHKSRPPASPLRRDPRRLPSRARQNRPNAPNPSMRPFLLLPREPRSRRRKFSKTVGPPSAINLPIPPPRSSIRPIRKNPNLVPLSLSNPRPPAIRGQPLRARLRPAATAAVTRGILPGPMERRERWADTPRTEAPAIPTEVRATREARIREEVIRADPEQADTRVAEAAIRVRREPAGLRLRQAAAIKGREAGIRAARARVGTRAGIKAAAADTRAARAVPEPAGTRVGRADIKATAAGTRAILEPAGTRAAKAVQQPAGIRAAQADIRAVIEAIHTIRTDRRDLRDLADTKDLEDTRAPADTKDLGDIRAPADTKDRAGIKDRDLIRVDNRDLSLVRDLPTRHRGRVAILPADPGRKARAVPGRGQATPCRADRPGEAAVSPAGRDRAAMGPGDRPMGPHRLKAARPRRGSRLPERRRPSTGATMNSRRSFSSRKRPKPGPSPYQSPSI